MIYRYTPVNGMVGDENGVMVTYEQYALLEEFEREHKKARAKAEEALEALQQENERLKAERREVAARAVETAADRLKETADQFGPHSSEVASVIADGLNDTAEDIRRGEIEV